MKTMDFKSPYFNYKIDLLEDGFNLKFRRMFKTYNIKIRKTGDNKVSTTDYYKFGDEISKNEFDDIEKNVRDIERLVMFLPMDKIKELAFKGENK